MSRSAVTLVENSGCDCPRSGGCGTRFALKGRVRRIRDNRGQALAEYAIAAFLTALGTYALVQGLLAALREYYQEVTTLLCLPIP